MKSDKHAPKEEPGGSQGPACFTPHADGVVFSVRAQPGARKTGFQGMVGDAAKLAVGAVAEDGKANDALVELIADLLKVRKSQVELIQGKTSRQKRFLVRGLHCSQAKESWSRVDPPRA